MTEQTQHAQPPINPEPERKPPIWPWIIGIPLGLLALLTVAVVGVGIYAYQNIVAFNVSADDNGGVEVQVGGNSIVAGPDYVQIRDSRSDSTESNWRTYLNGIVGAHVEWTGYVDHVGDHGQVWINMDRPGSGNDAPDVFIRVSENDPMYDQAQQYEHNQQITFRGGIKGFEGFHLADFDSFIVAIDGATID